MEGCSVLKTIQGHQELHPIHSKIKLHQVDEINDHCDLNPESSLSYCKYQIVKVARAIDRQIERCDCAW